MNIYQKLIFIHLQKLHHHLHKIKHRNMLDNLYLIQLGLILILIYHHIHHYGQLMKILIINSPQVLHQLFIEILNELLFKKIKKNLNCILSFAFYQYY